MAVGDQFPGHSCLAAMGSSVIAAFRTMALCRSRSRSVLIGLAVLLRGDDVGRASHGDARKFALEVSAADVSLYSSAFVRDGEAVPHDPDAVTRVFSGYSGDDCAVRKTRACLVDRDAVVPRCDDPALRDSAYSRMFLERSNAYLNKGEYPFVAGCAESYCRQGGAHFSGRDYGLGHCRL